MKNILRVPDEPIKQTLFRKNKTTLLQATAAFLASLFLYEAAWGLNVFLLCLLILVLVVCTRHLPRDEYYLFHLPIHNTDQLLPYSHTFIGEHQQALRARIVELEQETQNKNWKSWNLLNHYAVQHLEPTK
jgi:hypothetical protein